MTKKIAKEVPKTIIEQILDLFDKHVETTSAIVEDYIGGPGMTLELAAANENLRNDILFLDENEPGFEQLLKKLKELDSEELDSKKLMEIVVEADDYEPDEILDKMDESDVESYVAGKEGNCIIQTMNMNDRNKLENFVRSEIYPHENEFIKYVNI